MSQAIPIVSVVIPTRNRKDILRDAIESLFIQSYPNDRYEIIVIDNDSDDGTDEMVASLLVHAPCELKYIRKKDEGPGTSRNTGIQLARGSIIAFTDDDCVVDPYWLKNGISKIGNGVGLVQGKTLPNPRQEMKVFIRTMRIEHEDGLYQTCNMFYRKDILESVGGFSPEFIGLDRFGKPRWGCEDIDLAWKVKKKGWKSVFADDAIVYHHVFYIHPIKGILNYRMFRAFFHFIPYVIKKHPEMRKSALYRRYFFSKYTALFNLFIVALFLGVTIDKFFFLLIVPYMLALVRDSFRGRSLKTCYYGFVSAAFSIFFNFVIFILLLSGSIRCRSVVL
jgi:glycosyltransferase involved in cell wall biosynthesis